MSDIVPRNRTNRKTNMTTIRDDLKGKKLDNKNAQQNLKQLISDNCPSKTEQYQAMPGY